MRTSYIDHTNSHSHTHIVYITVFLLDKISWNWFICLIPVTKEMRKPKLNYLGQIIELKIVKKGLPVNATTGVHISSEYRLILTLKKAYQKTLCIHLCFMYIVENNWNHQSFRPLESLFFRLKVKKLYPMFHNRQQSTQAFEKLGKVMLQRWVRGKITIISQSFN